MTVWLVAAGFVGLVIGGAIERAVRRLPWGKSLIWPWQSLCESCWQPRALIDALPAIGYFFTRGRCSSCNGRRPWDELWVPLTAALLTPLIVYVDYERSYLHNINLATLLAAHLTLVYLLLAASAIDLKWMIIPDSVTVPGMIVGLVLHATTALSTLKPWVEEIRQPVFPPNFVTNVYLQFPGTVDGVLGLLIGGGVIWIVRWLGQIVFRREAMGFGDVTLMAMVGSLIGWQGAVMAFLLSPISALVVGAIGWMATGRSEIPYGPHLALASVAWVIFLPTMQQWAYPMYALPPEWLIGIGFGAAWAFLIVALGIRGVRSLLR